MSRPFLANWPGVCKNPDCQEPYKEGDSIRYDEENRIVHGNCEEVEVPTPKAEAICPTCHCTKPCFCD